MASLETTATLFLATKSIAIAPSSTPTPTSALFPFPSWTLSASLTTTSASTTPTSTSTATSTSNSCEFYINPSVFDPSTRAFAIHVSVWTITILFAAIATGFSLHLIYKHFRYYYRAEFQRYIVRILLMVPIYSILSSISFRYVWYAVYLDVIRDAYEGFVLYSFYTLLLHYLGLDPESQSAKLSHVPRRRLPSPLCCWRFTPGSKAFMVNCKVAVLQYAILRPTMAVLSVILESLGLLCPDEWGVAYGQFWVTLINFTSCTVALYALVLFYVVTHEELAEYRPLYKFIAIKFVIFFSYWQGLFLSLLALWGLFPESSYMSPANAQAAVQSFLICAEMVVAARLHGIAFPWQDFVPKVNNGLLQQTEIWIGLRDAFNMRDFARDVREAPHLAEEGIRAAGGGKAVAVAMLPLGLVGLSRGGTHDDDEEFGYDASRDPSRIQAGGGYAMMSVAVGEEPEPESPPGPARPAEAARTAAVPTRRMNPRDPFSLTDDEEEEEEEEAQDWEGDGVPLRLDAGPGGGGVNQR